MMFKLKFQLVHARLCWLLCLAFWMLPMNGWAKSKIDSYIHTTNEESVLDKVLKEINPEDFSDLLQQMKEKIRKMKDDTQDPNAQQELEKADELIESISQEVSENSEEYEKLRQKFKEAYQHMKNASDQDEKLDEELLLFLLRLVEKYANLYKKNETPTLRVDYYFEAIRLINLSIEWTRQIPQNSDDSDEKNKKKDKEKKYEGIRRGLEDARAEFEKWREEEEKKEKDRKPDSLQKDFDSFMDGLKRMKENIQKQKSTLKIGKELEKVLSSLSEEELDILIQKLIIRFEQRLFDYQFGDMKDSTLSKKKEVSLKKAIDKLRKARDLKENSKAPKTGYLKEAMDYFEKIEEGGDRKSWDQAWIYIIYNSLGRVTIEFLKELLDEYDRWIKEEKNEGKKKELQDQREFFRNEYNKKLNKSVDSQPDSSLGAPVLPPNETFSYPATAYLLGGSLGYGYESSTSTFCGGLSFQYFLPKTVGKCQSRLAVGAKTKYYYKVGEDFEKIHSHQGTFQPEILLFSPLFAGVDLISGISVPISIGTESLTDQKGDVFYKEKSRSFGGALMAGLSVDFNQFNLQLTTDLLSFTHKRFINADEIGEPWTDKGWQVGLNKSNRISITLSKALRRK